MKHTEVCTFHDGCKQVFYDGVFRKMIRNDTFKELTNFVKVQLSPKDLA